MMERRTPSIVAATLAILLAHLTGCDSQSEPGAAETAAPASPTVAQPGPSAEAQSSDAPAAESDQPAPQPVAVTPLQEAPRPTGKGSPSLPLPESALGEWPPIELLPPINDFGQVAPFTEATANFTIRNVGARTQQIVFVRPTCACLTFPNLMGVVIEAGKSITVPVTIAGREAVGPYRAGVQLRFNGYTKILRLTMQGDVQMPIVYEPLMIDVRSGGSEADLKGTIQVSSQNGSPFSVLSSNGQPPVFADGFNPETDQPKNNYSIQYDLSTIPCEQIKRWWVIETDDPQAPLLPVFVRHPCTNWPAVQGRTWSLDKLLTSAGVITPGHNKMIKISTKRIGDNTISEVTTDSPDMSVRLLATPEAPDDPKEDELIVLIMPNAGHQGPFYATLQFKTAADSEQLVVIGTVRE